LSGNQFQNGARFTGARVYAYEKGPIYSGTAARSIFYNVGNNAAAHQADTLYPARGVTAASTGYFIATDNCNGCSNVSVWKLTNPWGTSAFTLQGGVTVATYNQPPAAAQLGGGTIDSGDTRTLGGHMYNGTIYGSHTIGCNPGTGAVDCVQWYQVGNVDTTPTKLQEGTIGGNGQYRFYSTLAVDKVGDMTIGYDYSSTSEYAGIRYTGRLAGDAPGTVQAEATLKAGEVNANGTRWGDYSSESLAPDGCTVWHFGEYAQAGALWGTWAGSFAFSGCAAPPTPDYTLSASPPSQAVPVGSSTTYSVTINRTGGFTGAVTLSVSGLPTGATASFSSPNPTTGNSSVLTVNTGSNTPATTSTLTITGTSPSLPNRTTSVSLQVTDFTISISPASQTVAQGASTTYTVTVNRVDGHSGAVTFSTGALPSGVTASFSPNPTTATGTTSTLTLTTSSTTPLSSGTTFTVTGTSSPLARSASATLVVTAPPPADFSLSASPGSQTVPQGTGTSYTISITRTNGFSGAVTLTVGTLPAGVTASFSPNPTTGTSSTLTVTTATTTPTGTYAISITGTSGSLSHPASVQLVVIVNDNCNNC
jgi:hypothetical protein